MSVLRRCSRIPGPAASIQSAMDRKHHSNFYDVNNNNNNNIDNIDIDIDIDIDSESSLEFESNPRWLLALSSLGAGAGAGVGTSIKDIKNSCLSSSSSSSRLARFDLVVGLVKSCTPNGFGDFILTLKDPTDTITATLHHKLLTPAHFITAGSVLILQKVVAFPSSSQSCYLNITTTNLVKAISKESQVQYFQDTNQGIIPQGIPDNTSTLMSNRTMRLSQDLQLISTQANSISSSQHMESSANNVSVEPFLQDLDFAHKTLRSLGDSRDDSCRAVLPGPKTTAVVADYEDQARNVDSSPSIIENCANQHAWQQKGSELKRLLKGNTTSMTGKHRNPLQDFDSRSSSNAENLNEPDRATPNEVQKHGFQVGINSSLAENLVDQKIATPNDGKLWSVDLKQDDFESTVLGGIKKRRLGLISKTSVQEWTDEQLCVLDMDDD